jgi:hypothetical protein
MCGRLVAAAVHAVVHHLAAVAAAAPADSGRLGGVEEDGGVAVEQQHGRDRPARPVAGGHVHPVAAPGRAGGHQRVGPDLQGSRPAGAHGRAPAQPWLSTRRAGSRAALAAGGAGRAPVKVAVGAAGGSCRYSRRPCRPVGPASR